MMDLNDDIARLAEVEAAAKRYGEAWVDYLLGLDNHLREAFAEMAALCE